MSKEQRCEDCRFFDANQDSNDGRISFCGGEVRGGGECRKLPPVFRRHGDFDIIGEFPMVYLNSWCGEFQPLEGGAE